MAPGVATGHVSRVGSGVPRARPAGRVGAHPLRAAVCGVTVAARARGVASRPPTVLRVWPFPCGLSRVGGVRASLGVAPPPPEGRAVARSDRVTGGPLRSSHALPRVCGARGALLSSRTATSDRTWRPAEFKHISQRRKRN